MRRSEGSPWCIPCETRASPQLCVVIENSDIEMADASDRIKEHRERQQRLETAAEEARAMLAERRVMLDSADKIAAFAREMSEFPPDQRDHRDPRVRAVVRQGDPGQAWPGHHPLRDPDSA